MVNTSTNVQKSLKSEINSIQKPVSVHRLQSIFQIACIVLALSGVGYGLFQHHKKTPPEREKYETLLEQYKRAEFWHYWLYDYAINSKDKNPITHHNFIEQNPPPKVPVPFQ